MKFLRSTDSVSVKIPGIVILGAMLSFFLESDSLEAATIRVPDDHSTIQAAVDAAQTGDMVLVSPGTYRERLELKPGITVKSAGDNSEGKIGLLRAEKTIIDGAFENASGPGVKMAEDATLDGFTVTGVGEYDDEKWKYHHETQGNNQSHAEIGVPGTAGISVIGIGDCTVTRNIVHHVGYSGIAIMGAEGRRVSPHIYRNVTYRNMGGGIGSMKKSTARIEENVCFENFYAGIGHDNASPLVLNNICYHNIRAGIGISEGAQPIVRGNKCYENRRAGIGVRTGELTRPVIEQNECYDNDMAGIGASEESSPIIRNNRCYRNKLVGIGADSHATPTIIGNECFENERVGIGQQNGATTILIENYCHHNKQAGIGFENTDSGKATLLRNRVADNGKVSVGINAGWNVLLTGNSFKNGDGLPPVIMVHKGATATLIDNVISGGGVAGVRVAG
ncbi:MAG: right-handed parallel beta-helix repeat-containing protein, partial [Planctomycetaceae bacterium]|nr:right-handed parallel beta-helix repeat-containing protein [Planctomycetaceae bacterium]